MIGFAVWKRCAMIVAGMSGPLLVSKSSAGLHGIVSYIIYIVAPEDHAFSFQISGFML